MSFTTAPHIPVLPPYYARDLSAYAHTTQNTHPVQPYAYFLFLYQLPVYFPGVVFFLVVLAGLAGVVRNWRWWGGPQALPWVIAAISIVLPALLTQSLYRYTIVAIPLACLAAGLAFARRPAGPVLASSPAPGRGEQGTAPAGATDARHPPAGATDATRPPAGATDATRPPADATDATRPPADATDATRPPADGTAGPTPPSAATPPAPTQSATAPQPAADGAAPRPASPVIPPASPRPDGDGSGPAPARREGP